MRRLAILGSTRGTNLDALVSAIQQQQLNASIDLVLSNKRDAGILQKAQQYGLKNLFINPQGLDRRQYDAELTRLLNQHQIDLIILIGYMRILSAEFVTKWQNKIINTHPSLLPAYAGLMDLEVHRAVLRAKESISGCTVHWVTEQVDSGPILVQKTCSVFPDDTPELLKNRVQQLEGIALVEAINV